MQSSLAQLRRAAVEIGIFSFFINVLMLVMPLYMLQVYDRVIPSSSTETLLYLSVMAVGALVLVAVLEGVRGIYANRVAAGFDLAQSRNAILASMASPRAALGDIQLLRDIASVRAYVASRGAFAFFDLPFTPIFVGLLWFVHPLLFVLTVAGAVILVVVALVNQWAMAGVTRRATESGIAAMTTAQSFVRNSETLRAMGMIDNAIAAWARHHNPALVAGDELARLNAFFSGLARFLRLGLQIAILGVGGWLVVHGQMTAGMIFASSIISGRALQPLDQVIGGWRQFVDARGAWQRVRKGAAAVARGDYTELPDPKGRIDVEDLVYFVPNAGPKSEAILKRINLSFPAGSVTCIIGPSGAGKSTLARLLVGAIRARSGVIRLDGADIANWPPERLGRHIGYLPQDVELFPGTVAENICRFAPDASGEAIVAAAQHAQVHDLVLSLPDGYDTLIGPLGMMLSGGQRQRIGLARAFYGAPALLVLDEPNASLDSEGEAALERAIDAARAENATVVLITQRGAVARKADALLIMRDGMVADYGPREEVIARQQKAGSDEAARAKAAANANGVSGPKPAGAPGAKTSPFSAFGPGLRPLPPKKPKSSGTPDS